jgi:hypothetical protein
MGWKVTTANQQFAACGIRIAELVLAKRVNKQYNCTKKNFKVW